MLHLRPNPDRQQATLPAHRLLQDSGLSLTAVGLLARLMNAPASTSPDPNALALRCGTRRRLIKNALRELRAAGLLLPVTVRRPRGQEVTLICDDPEVLRAEFARLNAGGWFDVIALPVPEPLAEGRVGQARHARTAPQATHPRRNETGSGVGENSRLEHARHCVGEHGEHYHRRFFGTTNMYISSYANRAVASAEARAGFTGTQHP
jgi:hypothetical protein